MKDRIIGLRLDKLGRKNGDYPFRPDLSNNRHISLKSIINFFFFFTIKLN